MEISKEFYRFFIFTNNSKLKFYQNINFKVPDT